MSAGRSAVLISIAVTSAVAAGGGAGLTVVGRGRPRLAALGVPVVVVVALAAGVAAATRSMLISEDNYRTVLFVLLAGVPIAALVGLLLARRVQAMEHHAAAERAAYERDLAVETQRRELVSWLSHDLLTPLSGIRLIAESLRERSVGSSREAAELDRLLRESDRLSGMVDDLSELSRLHGPGADAASRRATVELGDLVSDAAAAIGPLAAADEISLRAGESSSETVVVDVRPLTRAVINILRNAAQHTPAGGSITVSTTVNPVPSVRVEDECGGISPGHLPYLFEAGWRADTARGTGGAGMGLGLAIAREVARSHGGEAIAANLPDGTGCAVELTLGPEGRSAD